MNPTLILSASYGEGHNAAARSLLTAFNELGGPSVAELLDPLALSSPRRDRIARWGYYQAINHLPRVWSAFYAWLDRTRPLPKHLWLLRREERLLEQILLEKQPAAVCCTYPVFAFMLTRIATMRGWDLPIYNVVTDSISINSMWWLSECRGWFLPNEESADVLREAGCPETSLHVMGFPVHPLFGRSEERLVAPDLARGAAPRVLYIINSGSSHATETARLLLAQDGWEITFAVGRDRSLREKISRLAAGRTTRTEVLGWTDQIPQLLMTHHAVVSKAGGATTQEAIAAHCPMIVNQVVPGQEEGNYELLRRHEIGARADTPQAVVRVLQNAFADRGKVWSGWFSRVSSLARSTAARDIAEFVHHRHGGTSAPDIPPTSSPQPQPTSHA